MPRALLMIAIAIGVGAFACSKLWPERLAVNVPIVGTFFGAEPPPASQVEQRLVVPDGFEVAQFATGIDGARMLKFTPVGDLLVSSPSESSVFLLERDANGDGRADGTKKLVEGLDNPHGLELIDGWLYIAEEGAIK